MSNDDIVHKFEALERRLAAVENRLAQSAAHSEAGPQEPPAGAPRRVRTGKADA